MKSIGAIDVKNALFSSRIKKSFVLFERAPARITNSASEVMNGLQTVEMMRAVSVHTRLRMRSGVRPGGGDTGTGCTRTGLRVAQSNPLR